MQFDFDPTQDDLVRAVRHAAGISFPVFRASLPWHARSVGPFTRLDAGCFPVVVGLVAAFQP